MVRRVLALGLPLVLAANGCLPQEQPNHQLVQPSPLVQPGQLAQASQFGPTPTIGRKETAYAAATEETFKRVQTVGGQIITANRAIGLRPMFLAIGDPRPEVFHRDLNQIWVTEGLAKQCLTDRMLAAVLCLELGKMVAEREAMTSAQIRQPDVEPPPGVHIGGDSGGTFGAADATRLAELGRFEQNHRSPNARPLPPPDPQVLARSYLAKAGYAAADLDAVLPIVQAAQKNFAWERQMTAAPQEQPQPMKPAPPGGQTPPAR
jgi:hypothetical protein